MNSNVRAFALGAIALLSSSAFPHSAVGKEGIYYSHSKEESSVAASFDVKESTHSCFFERLRVVASDDTFEQQIGNGKYKLTKSWVEVSLQEINKCGASPTTRTSATRRVETTSEEFDRDAETPSLNIDVELLRGSEIAGIARINLRWPREDPPIEIRRVIPMVTPNFIFTEENIFALRPTRVEGFVEIIGRNSFYAEGEDVQKASLKKAKVRWISQPR